jgi:hypothetical protein
MASPVTEVWHPELRSKITTKLQERFAYYLEKLPATADGDGSLLDHVMIIYVRCGHERLRYAPVDLPLLLVGRGAGQIDGGRHLRYPADTPLATYT